MPRFRRYRACCLLGLLLALWTQFAVAESNAKTVANALPLQRQVAVAVARDLGVNSGNEGEAPDLSVLAGPLALPAGAGLRIVSVKRGFTPDTWFVRLDCAARRDCLPFDALLRTADGAFPKLHGGKIVLPSALPAAQRWRRSLSSADVVARSGERVELVENLSGMRLSVRAICLEPGGLGDRIRVRNLATHRVVNATVAGKGQVRVP